MFDNLKETRVKIYLQGKALKADVSDSENEMTIIGVESINTFLRQFYEAEGNTIGDLINDGRVRIASTKVWDRYSLAGNRFFCEVKDLAHDELLREEEERKAREEQKRLEEERKEYERKRAEELAKRKAEEEKARKEAEEKARKEAEEKGEEDDKEEKEEKGKPKKGVKFRNFCVRTLAVVAAGFLLCEAVKLFKHDDTENENTNDDIYTGELDLDGEQYTYNLNDNDVIEQVYENKTGRYESLGSIIDYDDMETQLEVIDNCVIRDELFGFENLVVPDDYEAVRTISNLRTDVINGNLENTKFIDMLVDYIFGGNKYVNGNIIEEYNSLHPYSQYSVVRILQGRLQFAPDYNNGTYDFNSLANLCDVYGSDLYEILMGLKKAK